MPLVTDDTPPADAQRSYPRPGSHWRNAPPRREESIEEPSSLAGWVVTLIAATAVAIIVVNVVGAVVDALSK